MRRATNGHYIFPRGVGVTLAGFGEGEVSVTPSVQPAEPQAAPSPAASVPLNVSPAGRSGNARGAALAVAQARGAPTHLGRRMQDRSYITANPLNRRFPKALVGSFQGLGDFDWGSDLFSPLVQGVTQSIPGLVNAAVGNKPQVVVQPPAQTAPAAQSASMGTSLLLYGALGVGAIVVLSMVARRNS